MAVRTKSEIMCGFFFPRHHEENPRNSIDHGMAHLWWLRSCPMSLIECKKSKIAGADWLFNSTGLSHTRARALTVSHPRERCHQTGKCKAKNHDTITLAHSLNWQTRVTLMSQLSLHYPKITRNQGLNPKEKCRTLVNTTPNKFTTYPTDLVKSTPECKDAFLQEGELCNACTDT